MDEKCNHKDIICKKNYRLILNFIIKLGLDKHKAEDVAQDTVVTFKTCYPDKKICDNLSLAYKIAKNKVYSYFRGSHHIKMCHFENLSNICTDNSEQINLCSLIEDVHDVIDRLNDELKKIIILIYYKGYTSRESALILNKPQSYVEYRLRVAKNEIRKHLFNND